MIPPSPPPASSPGALPSGRGSHALPLHAPSSEDGHPKTRSPAAAAHSPTPTVLRVTRPIAASFTGPAYPHGIRNPHHQDTTILAPTVPSRRHQPRLPAGGKITRDGGAAEVAKALTANPALKAKYDSDAAFKTGFDSLVWAKQRGAEADYEATIQHLDARDARYVQHHIQYRG